MSSRGSSGELVQARLIKLKARRGGAEVANGSTEAKKPWRRWLQLKGDCFGLQAACCLDTCS